jgi:lipopolysaccharide export system permease protein
VIIFRYLARELYSHLLAITLILFAIFITNQFMLYLKDVAKGQITLIVVGKLILLQIPLLLGFLLPLALFLSILLVFGRLYVDHEMTVFSACGLSQNKLLVMVINIAMVVFLVVSGLMLWFEPIMQSYREKVFDYAIAEATVAKIIPQQFEYFGANRVFYAQTISRQQHSMNDVFFATEGKANPDGTHAWDMTIAKQAAEKHSLAGDQFLVFNDGHRYLGTPGQADFEVASFKEYGLKPALNRGTLKVWPKDVPTLELWKIRHEKSAAAAELQWRIAMPISVLILTLLAFPLSRVNPRLGKFTNLLPAILLYVVYSDLLFLGKAWIKRDHLDPMVGLWWIHGLMFGIVIIIFSFRFWRQRRG